MASPVFVIANQKGGVGKTTTAIQLSAALAGMGIDTLLIDLDSQANATSGLGIGKESGASLYEPLLGEGSAIDKIRETGRDHLYLIPSERDIAALEVELPQREGYLAVLREKIDEIRNAHDFRAIVIDCPPSAGVISLSGLAAADHLIITLQCEYLAMEGLGEILSNVEQIRESGLNPGLNLGGILMTMFDIRTKLSQQVVRDVRAHFGGEVFETMIPRSIRLSEAPSFGQSIFEYEPTSSGAEAYKTFAGEVCRKFGLSPRE